MAMTREELIKLGNLILDFEGTEEEHTELLLLFDNNVPHPQGSTLFFYPENYNARKDDRSQYNPSVEEVVDKALSYKSIHL
ncbi:bacteriocin immunity protein [Flectobacillus longus]|uniref:bacteriocin immunity protein n=1 Tax=Flectobacillus longus TaxID=2984207 RepID=UPI0024B79580|nr:bacteriocin immunity protein [Flectobacillus longus]MDI9881117.1 bacteriocin immunity protein [Flectobacillus longus]